MWMTGYVTQDEIKELRELGWGVEEADKYNLVGKGKRFLMAKPKSGDVAVVIYVDGDLLCVARHLAGGG